MQHKIFYCVKLSNKQSAKVICRFDRLRTAHSKSQKAIYAMQNLSTTYAFDYIVLRVKPGLTSCEYVPCYSPEQALIKLSRLYSVIHVFASNTCRDSVYFSKHKVNYNYNTSHTFKIKSLYIHMYVYTYMVILCLKIQICKQSDIVSQNQYIRKKNNHNIARFYLTIIDVQPLLAMPS